jgi:hypothetical protein
MKNKGLIPIVILCVVLVFGANLYAQEEESLNRRIGSSAATELLIPVGGAGLAMAGSHLATAAGVDAIHWNPAGLARMEHSSEAMLSSMAYIADIRVNYGAVGVRFGEFGTVGVAAKMLNFGDIPLTTNEDPEALQGRTYSPNFLTLGLTYSRRFTDAITVGVTFKVISEKIVRVNGSAIAFDIGVQYHSAGGIPGLNFAIALKNYGPHMKFSGTGLLRRAIATDGLRPEQFYQMTAATYELPSTLEIGMSYVRDLSENLDFAVNGAFINNNMALNSYRVGGQLGFAVDELRVYGRAGYEIVPGNDIDEDIFGICFGGGVYYRLGTFDFMLDYAYRQTEYFDDNSLFTLRFGF